MAADVLKVEHCQQVRSDEGVGDRVEVRELSQADQLWTAVCSGDRERTLSLLDAHVHCPPDKDGFGLLHYAAANNYPDIVSLLLERGYSVDQTSKLGYTAVQLAAAKGHESVVQILLSTAKCPHASHDTVNGNSALHEAAFNGYSRTVSLLIRYSADTNSSNFLGLTPLHLAAQAGHNECGRLLLYSGANPDLKNTYGDSALHTAARYGHAGVTRILISAHCQLNECNKNGDTALHISAALKQKKITRLLLDAGADIFIRNNCNERPLDTARRKNNTEIISLLSPKNYSVESSPAKVKSNASSSSSKTDVSPAPTGTAPAGATAAYNSRAAEDESKQQTAAAVKNKKKWNLFSKKSKKKTEQKDTPLAPGVNVPHSSAKGSSDIQVRIPPSGLAPWGAPFPQHIDPGFKSWPYPHTAPWDPQPNNNAAIVMPKFPAHISPETVLTSFYQQHLHRQTLPLPPGQACRSDGMNPSVLQSGAAGSVYGIADKYTKQQGFQYYRDLAGHVKKGPVGFAPIESDIESNKPQCIKNVQPNIQHNIHPNFQQNIHPNIHQDFHSNIQSNHQSNFQQNIHSNIPSNIQPNIQSSMQFNQHALRYPQGGGVYQQNYQQSFMYPVNASYQNAEQQRHGSISMVRRGVDQQYTAAPVQTTTGANNRTDPVCGTSGVVNRQFEHIGYLRSRQSTKRRGITQLSDYYTSLQPAMLALNTPRPAGPEHRLIGGPAVQQWSVGQQQWGQQWSAVSAGVNTLGTGLYRSRSDETISTASSRPVSHHYHRVKPSGTGTGRDAVTSVHDYEVLQKQRHPKILVNSSVKCEDGGSSSGRASDGRKSSCEGQQRRKRGESGRVNQVESGYGSKECENIEAVGDSAAGETTAAGITNPTTSGSSVNDNNAVCVILADNIRALRYTESESSSVCSIEEQESRGDDVSNNIDNYSIVSSTDSNVSLAHSA